jgi:DNA-binding response OmpR family regulator
MHLLLVEDDQGIITPLRMYLEQAGHTVVVCSDGLMAVDVWKKENPSLIILDINLPGKNGVEICREIRLTSRTPIIVLSARESEDDKVTLLELGADDYVSKPFSSRELVARITAVAKRAEEKKENGKKEKMVTFGNVTLDTKNYTAYLS